MNDDTLIEMTWKEGVVKLLDANTLKEIKQMKMWDGVKEGWGITLDPVKQILYVSDGSDKITRVDARTLKQLNQFTVKKLNGQPQNMINELEFVNGSIWANIFYFDGMVRIDPDSGYIQEAFDFAPLREAEMKVVQELGQKRGYDWNNNVCNGIAYIPAEDAFLVTGKRWNLLFKIKLAQRH